MSSFPNMASRCGWWFDGVLVINKWWRQVEPALSKSRSREHATAPPPLMTVKRPFNAHDDDDDDSTTTSTSPTTSTHPPQKRHRPTTVATSSSPSTATSSSSLATPYSSTPYTYTPPSDSPTNPFGRIRKFALTGQSLTLPRATSFSKHLPLRFQLVRTRAVGGSGAEGEGTYRVVQVPLNYTFRHFRKLLHFLFDHDASRTSGSQKLPCPGTGQLEEGHLFEVQDSIRMYKSFPFPAKPGQIRTGHTWAKLSSVRDPFRTTGHDHDDDSGEGEDDWIWETEEDFTLGHVWPEGGDLRRGCIYHHTSTTQIHITINTTRIPGRKGVGNKPFVFAGFGRGWGVRVGEKLTKKSRDEGEGSESESESEEDEASADDDDDDEDEEDWGGRIDASRWNGHEAFEKFLKRDAEREREQRKASSSAAYIHDADEDDDEEGLDSAQVISTQSTSSPFPPYSSSSLSSSSYPNPYPLPTQTPLPQTKLHRLRVQYASKRMERLNKKGLGELGNEVGFVEGDDGDAQGGELDGEEEEV